MSHRSFKMKMIALKNATEAHAMACGTVAMPWPTPPTDEERAAVMTTFDDLCGAMTGVIEIIEVLLPSSPEP